MSTTTEHEPEHPVHGIDEVDAEGHVPDATHGHTTHETHPDSFYVRIAVILALMTALEVSTYYYDFGPLFLPLLLTLMCIKFFMVVWFFMHLRDDSRLLSKLFWSGLFLAVGVYVAALSTFHFFIQ